MGNYADLTGLTFGNIRVIRRQGLLSDRPAWLCECKLCGNTKVMRAQELKKAKSCGCLKGGYTDLTGKRFGMLLVLKRDNSRETKWIYWLCKCDCGTIRPVNAVSLHNGNARSCGCRQGNIIHGMRNSPTYQSWVAMKNRCTNPNGSDWKHYGGRGITICDRWLNSFQAFFDDMGERPEGMTLDRINPNGNYEPSNCRWLSVEDQARNRRPYSNASKMHQS